MITFGNLEEFRESYLMALNEGREIFTFEGSEVLTSYAKYVLMYFDMRLKGLEKN